MAKEAKRPKAVFHFRKVRALGDFIIKVQGLVAQMGDRTDIFTSPSPTLLAVTGHISALQNAQAIVETRLIGSAAKRDVKYSVVCKDIFSLMGYVQALANKAGSQMAAIAIISASGFSVKGTNTFTKPPLAAKNTKMQRTVLLLAKAAAKRASYRWQQSTDKTNWIELPITLKAKALAKNLEPGIWYFRFRSVTKDGETDWCVPVKVVVQ